MKRLLLFLGISFYWAWFCCQNIHAASVTLGWDASTSSTVTGYKLYTGYSSRDYGTPVDVKKVLQYTLNNIQNGVPVFFAATAYDAAGKESGYSDELKCYTILSSITGQGTVSPDLPMVVSNGMNTTVIFTPATGYTVADVKLDGVSIGVKNSYTLSNITACHTFAVTFAQVPVPPTNMHIVLSSASAGGSINPSGSVAIRNGDSITFSMRANRGYRLKYLTVDGKNIKAQSSYTFRRVTSDHTIYARFDR